jgi:hypothetical protein
MFNKNSILQDIPWAELVRKRMFFLRSVKRGATLISRRADD